MPAMGRRDREGKRLFHCLTSAFRKAISGMGNAEVALHRRLLQCWGNKRGMYLKTILPLILAIPAFSQLSALPDLGAASAATVPDPSLAAFESSQRRYLLGDWGGRRTSLAEKGVTFDFFYISDMQANPSGGRQQTHWVGKSPWNHRH